MMASPTRLDAGTDVPAQASRVPLSDTLRQQLEALADNKHYMNCLHEENVSLEQFNEIKGCLDESGIKLVMTLS